MNGRCRRVWGNNRRGVGLLCLVGFFLGGCGVGQSRYDAVVADMESARVDLENVRMVREALELENEKLRADNEKVALALEVMGAEIQRIKESRESEQALLDAHDAELEKVRQAQLRELQGLRREYRKLTSQNRTLRGTVRHYQKELKDVRESSLVRVPQSHNGASSAESMADENIMPGSPSGTMPLNGSTELLNLNTASVNDFVVMLGFFESMAERVIANRPYRVRGELLARKVIPVETFELVKDKMTAAPN